MLSGLALGSKSKYGDFSSGTDSGFARDRIAGYGLNERNSGEFAATLETAVTGRRSIAGCSQSQTCHRLDGAGESAAGNAVDRDYVTV